MLNVDYHDAQAYEYLEERYIEEQMEAQRKEKVKFLATIVRQDLAEDFAKILSAAYGFDDSTSEIIFDKIGFNQSDFLAIDRNFQEYKRQYRKNLLENMYE